MSTQVENQTASRRQAYSAADESRLILSLFMEIGTADFWEGFMERFAKLAGFSAAMVASANLQGGEMKSIWCHQLDMEAIRDYIASGYACHDDLIKLCISSPPGQFYSHRIDLIRHMDPETDSEVYREWVAPQGMADVAMAQLEQAGSWSTVITIYRHQPAAPFSEVELRQFDRLIPHIRRALWLQGDLLRQQRLPEEVERWMSLVKVPMLLFDEQFNCCEHNRAARELFARQRTLSLVDGRLTLENASDNRQLSYEVIHAIKSASGQIKDTTLRLLHLDVAGQPTNFVFIPVKSPADSPLSAPGALAFIHQCQSSQMPDFSSLQVVYQFTDAELAVCVLLARGHSVQDIAGTMEKSAETVRSQLKQVFSKTGTGSQSELILTLLTHPAFLGAA